MSFELPASKIRNQPARWSRIQKQSRRRFGSQLKAHSRPGQKTNAVQASHPDRILFWRIFCSPYHARGAVSVSLAALRRMLRSDNAGQSRPVKSEPFTIFPATLRWPAASSSVCGGSSEEAATPGHHHASIFRNHHSPKRIAITNQSAFLGNPPDDSPSRFVRIR